MLEWADEYLVISKKYPEGVVREVIKKYSNHAMYGDLVYIEGCWFRLSDGLSVGGDLTPRIKKAKPPISLTHIGLVN